MQAINIDLHSAQKITCLDDSEVLISIGNHFGTEHVSIKNQEHKILKVVFDDVTAKLECKGEIFTPIDGYAALEIIKFIEQYKNKNFIVHCHAGISRSSAVCLYMHLFYGHKLKENFWNLSHPNPYVLGKLILVRAALWRNYQTH